MKRRFVLMGLSLAAIAGTIAACTSSPTSTQSPAANPQSDAAATTAAAPTEVLRVGSEGDYPPFSKKNPDGSISGFDIDVANALCAKMQMKCDVVQNEWPTIIPSLNAGKYDVIISSMSITDERKQQVLFTQPYYKSPYAFIAKQGTTFETTADGLADKKVCVFKNSVAIKWLEANAPQAELLQYDDTQTLRTDLIAGRCATAMDSKLSLQGIIDTPEGKDYQFVGQDIVDPILGEGVGIAVRKDDQALLDRLNNALDEIYADGTFKTINDQYFNFDIGAK